MKILHLPRSVGSNAYNLSIGEKKNGEDSTVLICDPDIYSNESEADLIFPVKKNNKLTYLYQGVRLLLFLVFRTKKYDVLHYNFGSPVFFFDSKLLFGLDVRLFKKLNKVIAVTYQGSDARQADYCLEHYDNTFYTPEDVCCQRKKDRMKRYKIEFFEKNSDIMYGTNPDLLNILPEKAKFRPYTKLQPYEWQPCYSDYSRKKTVILHAPTHKKVKGTEHVDAAIERLKNEGYDIEYLLLQNIPTTQVIEYYKRADIAVDQLMVGFYGGFAVECMAMGKPVMCYIRQQDMKWIPEEMAKDMPIIRVTKEDLYEKLKYYIEHKEELENIARKSRQYVEKWHDPEKIAKDIIEDYKNAMENKK